MRIAVGSDHAGFEGPPPLYKPEIIAHLRERGHEVVDCGTDGPGSVDYPDFADAVAEAILTGKAERGVLICGTGMGISMAANRHTGIRAAVVVTPEMAELARSHNDANVIAIGRRTSSLEDAKQLVDIWLDTPFSGGERHVRRIGKMG